MGNYLGMLIALLSSKRKLRNRLGSSLVNQSCNHLEQWGCVPLREKARNGESIRAAEWDSVRLRICDSFGGA